jgi:NADPH:quinone reductase-like Zn-dependent oxidoreductase
MKAARIHRFGAPDVVVVEEMPHPAPAEGELLIRVAASGVGPWDALIREGKSKVSPPPPLTLGSDLSGMVEETGPSVSEFKKGDEIYGVTNPQFCGANAQYAVARGVLVSVVSTDPIRQRPDARSALFYAEVTTERLNGISRLFYSGQLIPQVGSLLR